MEFERLGRMKRRQALKLSALTSLGALWPTWAEAAHAVKSWPLDRATPPLDLTDLDGRTWALAAVRGRGVVLNFWASWCAPCRDEMPSLERLARRHQDAGLMVLAVNYKETVAEIKHFLEAHSVALPILLDRDGDGASAWTPRVFPTTVLIDRTGRPYASVLGELDWAGPEAAGLLAPLLTKPKAA